MDIITGKRYAVITGDIVGSSKFPEKTRRHLHAVMTAGALALCKVFGDAVPLELETFRGDAWQVVVADPARALRIGSFYRAFLRAALHGAKADSRMAIAVGTIDFIPAAKVSSGDGQAYRLSGSLIERMPRQQRLSFAFAATQGDDRMAALETVIQLMDVLAANWSEKQAQAVTGALQGWTQEKIATTCWPQPITQQAVAQHLDRAGWHAFEKGLLFFEQTLEKVLAR
ncbi:MAG: hypothetical protein U5R30_17745 [Deltaproteobacteria bacterium]|nr:hypothetical protein [Deltaproteobacteria bacterium]